MGIDLRLTDNIPVKMMMDPLSICQTDAVTYSSPIPDSVVPSRSHRVGKMIIGWKNLSGE